MMSELHNRIPAILDPRNYDLVDNGQTEEVRQLLKPCPPSEWLRAYPASRQVNSLRIRGPELLNPLA
jgi:putative SOS response-associated peptidase YedK